MVLLALWAGHYAYNRYHVEAARWHIHERRMQTERPAHHFHNRGGVVVEKEFVGFNKYFTDGENQMEWLKQAYPEIYREEESK